jgi:hypothetical protein
MISINIQKAKEIAHDIRRKVREEKFKVYDEIIMKQIPGNDLQETELARQQVRDSFAEYQTAIDLSETAQDIKLVLSEINE